MQQKHNTESSVTARFLKLSLEADLEQEGVAHSVHSGHQHLEVRHALVICKGRQHRPPLLHVCHHTLRTFLHVHKEVKDGSSGWQLHEGGQLGVHKG